MAYDDPCARCSHARDMHTPVCQIIETVETLTVGPLEHQCACVAFVEHAPSPEIDAP